MSKMGQELEDRLDANKYELYGLLREIHEAELGPDIVRVLLPWSVKVERVLAKVDK